MTMDELQPTATESGQREAVPGGRPAALPMPILLLVAGGGLFSLIAAATSFSCLLVMKKNDAQANSERRSIFELDQTISVAQKNTLEQLNALALSSKETATANAEKQQQSLDAILTGVKAGPADTAKTLQPILSNIGIAVTDRVAAEITKTAEERKALTASVASINQSVSATADRLTALETAVKAATAQSEETRTSVAAANDRVKEALSSVSSEGSGATSLSDLQKALTEVRATQTDLLNQVRSMNARMNRGL